MSQIKTNLIYNMVYQVLILIIPLILAPYLSRTLGVEGIGIYSYTYSVVNYFTLFCLLGLNNYGNRTIAKVRDNKDKVSETFWSLYYFQLFMGIVLIIIYLIYVCFSNFKYRNIALIQTIYIFSALLDINWLYFGLEKFKITVIRNTIIKIITLFSIFYFVKCKEDLWKYALIMSTTTVLSQIILWTLLKKEIKFHKFNIKEVIKHIKPNVLLFIPVIAVSIYKIMDKIMIGNISNIEEVGLYENAEKIINVPIALITALGTVMLPRMSNIIEKGENKKANEYIKKSIEFVMFMSIPMCLGLISIASKFAPLYYGEFFEKTGILIILLSTTIPFIAFANVIRTQYIIPREKDNIYIKSVILGAIINFIANLIFIPSLESKGACIGTIIAEVVVMLYQCVSVKNELNILDYLKICIKFLVNSVIMFFIIESVKILNLQSYFEIFLQIVLGCVIYSILNIKYILGLIKKQ